MRRNIRTGARSLVAALALSACATGGATDEGSSAAAEDEAAVVEEVASDPDDDATDGSSADDDGPVTGGAGVGGTDVGLDTGLAVCTDLPGAAELDPDEATERLLATLDDPGTASRADADLTPLTKAVLVVDADEPDLPHVRYRVRAATVTGDDGTATDLVRVERFNLGPAVREELVATQGEDVVAPPDVFGEGPHVAYCFESRTIQAMTADVVALTRAELPVDAPASATCLGTGCGDIAWVADAATTWQEGDELRLPAAVYDVLRDGAPSPAVALDLALAEVGLATRDGDTIRWHGPEPREGLASGEAFIEAVIDVGLAQDSSIDLALREGHLMDDMLAAVWQRVTGVATGDPARPLLVSASAVEERQAP